MLHGSGLEAENKEGVLRKGWANKSMVIIIIMVISMRICV